MGCEIGVECLFRVMDAARWKDDTNAEDIPYWDLDLARWLSFNSWGDGEVPLENEDNGD